MANMVTNLYNTVNMFAKEFLIDPGGGLAVNAVATRWGPGFDS